MEVLNIFTIKFFGDVEIAANFIALNYRALKVQKPGVMWDKGKGLKLRIRRPGESLWVYS